MCYPIKIHSWICGQVSVQMCQDISKNVFLFAFGWKNMTNRKKLSPQLYWRAMRDDFAKEASSSRNCFFGLARKCSDTLPCSPYMCGSMEKYWRLKLIEFLRIWCTNIKSPRICLSLQEKKHVAAALPHKTNIWDLSGIPNKRKYRCTLVDLVVDAQSRTPVGAVERSHPVPEMLVSLVTSQKKHLRLLV